MLAIHNFYYFFVFYCFVANAYAKLSKCQQFTTSSSLLIKLLSLQTLMQSYQNVSNSQPVFTCCLSVSVANAYAKLSKCQQFTTINASIEIARSCKRLCKVIKMLAIHNCFNIISERVRVANAYAKLSKCQQFTTIISSVFLFLCCKRLCKVIKMLAIHNYNQFV